MIKVVLLLIASMVIASVGIYMELRSKDDKN